MGYRRDARAVGRTAERPAAGDVGADPPNAATGGSSGQWPRRRDANAADVPETRLARLRAALAAGRPLLCVIVDTEEEFDWSRPLSRDNRSVTNIAAQDRAQAIFAEFGIVPTYVVDYPVAADAGAAAILRDYRDRGACEIGAHCHPWVNPPEDETVTPYASYAGNLPADLEHRKLATLTRTITDAFGQHPRIYKAGRYGLGPNTPAILRTLGYIVDASIVPHTSFAADGGPDFTAAHPGPHALPGTQDVLALPLSTGFAGVLRRYGPSLFVHARSPWARRLRVPGILARARLLERIRLTPEGITLPEQRRLTRCLLNDGMHVLSYSYHSPSLAPGNTPYVRGKLDLQRFLDDMRRYFAYVIDDLGGLAATPSELYALWRAGVPLGRAPTTATAE